MFGYVETISRCDSAKMPNAKVRIKFGEHEIEAEGSEEAVDRHLAMFKLLIAPPPPMDSVPIAPSSESPKVEPLALDKILRVHQGIVSMKVSAKPDDAILVVLLGLSELCQRHIISGAEIMDGLRASGLRVTRADPFLRKHADGGRIIAIGRRRSRRYQFSKQGREHAQQIARNLISQLPSEQTEVLAPQQ